MIYSVVVSKIYHFLAKFIFSFFVPPNWLLMVFCFSFTISACNTGNKFRFASWWYIVSYGKRTSHHQPFARPESHPKRFGNVYMCTVKCQSTFGSCSHFEWWVLSVFKYYMYEYYFTLKCSIPSFSSLWSFLFSYTKLMSMTFDAI